MWKFCKNLISEEILSFFFKCEKIMSMFWGNFMKNFWKNLLGIPEKTLNKILKNLVGKFEKISKL